MSDHAAAGHSAAEPHAAAAGHAAATAPENPFSHEELAQFDSDDTTAGRNIGKLLATIFLYTIIVMSAAAWWTFGRN